MAQGKILFIQRRNEVLILPDCFFHRHRFLLHITLGTNYFHYAFTRENSLHCFLMKIFLKKIWLYTLTNK